MCRRVAGDEPIVLVVGPAAGRSRSARALVCAAAAVSTDVVRGDVETCAGAVGLIGDIAILILLARLFI
jgi:hypothetical protein